MCLAFRQSNPLPRLVAEVDITIYKVVERVNLSGDLYSIFKGMPIKLGVVYTSGLDTPSTKGSFAFSNKDHKLLGGEACMFVGVGLHAFVEQPIEEDLDLRDDIGSTIVVLKGFIPKGSEYYVNEETGMIVAGSMCYSEIVSI